MTQAPPLNIGLSATLLYDPQSRGTLDGIGVYTKAMHTHLARLPGVAVTPVVMGRIGSRHVPADAVCYPGPARFDAAFSCVRWNAALAKPGDRDRLQVYFATDYRVPLNAALPVCATFHDAIPLSHPEWANPRLRELKNVLLRRAARAATRIIAISEAMVPEIIEHYGVPAERVTVVPNGVGTSWFQREEPKALRELRSRYHLAERYFLFVGTLQPRKNVERILTAYASLPEAIRREYQLVIAGKEGWRAGPLVSELQSLQAAGRVRWLQRVPETDLRALYQAAMAFVFPSLYEGFGLPVLEAFASGVPVITSNVTSLPEVAGDAALLVDPMRTDAIAEAMGRMAGDASLRDRLVRLGSARARLFTWGNAARQTIAVMRELV
jgi:glycosyltransferase involved in cell wall biosynthesis